VNRCAALLALVLASRGGVAAAQSPITVQLRDAGPGIGPELVAQELARPYAVVAVEPTRYLLRRDSTATKTLIVLGRDIVIEGQVKGDVLAIAGDIYMHPGGSISGRAISVGGGVYESTLATIGAGTTRFNDFTYAITLLPGTHTYALDYTPIRAHEELPLTLPGFFGFRLPTYDRSDGLSLAFGPQFKVPNTKLALLPRITYRSQLGEIDPGLVAVDSLDRRTAIHLVAERGTYSNDAWIRPDLVNSTDFFFAGSDARNYYRANVGELTIARRWESVNGELTPYIGAHIEQASAVRPDSNALGGPWTVFARHDREQALRANPQFLVNRDLESAVLGATWQWARNGLVAFASGREEIGSWKSGGCLDCTPAFDQISVLNDASFSQLTLHGTLRFPTFGSQTFRFEGHVVTPTGGASTPFQRYVYLGGAGTLPTFDMLELGGDHLAYFDFRYNIPIDPIKIPLVGPPVVTIREALGTAGVGGWPNVHQNTGARLSVSFLYGEWLFDPVAHRGHSAFGLTLTR
jgi:hypothetical protein